MKPKVTWILIADGAHARILENTGPGRGLTQVEGLVFDNEPLTAREIESDRPGRAFSSASADRSAMEPPTDPVEYRESEFLRRVADVLLKQHHQQKFDR